MTPERWKQIESTFQAAMDLPRGAREAFLQTACKDDDALLRYVRSLIKQSDQTGEFLERPAMEVEAASMAKSGPALIGSTIGNYRVDSFIGAGGMAEVYRACDSKHGRDVALKVIEVSAMSGADRIGRFRREARVLSSLQHPNIAAMYEFVEEHGIHALALELVDGESLSQRLARGRPSVAETMNIARQIAEGVKAAHAQEIIHRDLKPDNVIIAGDGTVKILDFGIARILGATSESIWLTPMTRSALIVGTAAYMSPERIQGETGGKAVDVWAWGCILYEMLSGRRAFDGQTLGGISTKILEQDPDWNALPSDVPARISELLRSCLEKDPSRRPATISLGA